MQPFDSRPLVLVSNTSGTSFVYVPHIACGQPARGSGRRQQVDPAVLVADVGGGDVTCFQLPGQRPWTVHLRQAVAPLLPTLHTGVSLCSPSMFKAEYHTIHSTASTFLHYKKGSVILPPPEGSSREKLWTGWDICHDPI